MAPNFRNEEGIRPSSDTPDLPQDLIMTFTEHEEHVTQEASNPGQIDISSPSSPPDDEMSSPPAENTIENPPDSESSLPTLIRSRTPVRFQSPQSSLPVWKYISPRQTNPAARPPSCQPRFRCSWLTPYTRSERTVEAVLSIKRRAVPDDEACATKNVQTQTPFMKRFRGDDNHVAQR